MVWLPIKGSAAGQQKIYIPLGKWYLIFYDVGYTYASRGIAPLWVPYIKGLAFFFVGHTGGGHYLRSGGCVHRLIIKKDMRRKGT